MKLKKCANFGKHEKIIYTLKENCILCGEKTKDAHYKFIKKASSVSQD